MYLFLKNLYFLYPETLLRAFGTYVQYEFSIAIEDMQTCFAKLVELMDWGLEVRRELRLAPLIRFVKQNNAYLSTTLGGPRMSINFDNYEFTIGKDMSQK